MAYFELDDCQAGHPSFSSWKVACQASVQSHLHGDYVYNHEKGQANSPLQNDESEPKQR